MSRIHEAPPAASAQVVTDFLASFMSGDVERARSLVTPDFSFTAPFNRNGSCDAYFAGAARKAGFIQAFRILRQWADGDHVSTLYELALKTSEGTDVVTMSEWHTLVDRRIRSTTMVFDTASSGVQLLRRALASQ